MSLGISNEYLAYAIVDLARQETKRFLNQQGRFVINQSEQLAQQNPVIPANPENDVKLISNVLATLESNDYKLRLVKNDSLNPKMLTGVIIEFKQNVKQIIDLVRAGKRLTSVVITVYIKDDTQRDTSNPFGMPTSIFLQYFQNKQKWIWANGIKEDPNSTPEEKEEAENIMTQASLENQGLRNLFGILTDDYPLNDLVIFLPNPLGMGEEDFIKYVLNKRIWYVDAQNMMPVTQQQKDAARDENINLREKYLIEIDTYNYPTISAFNPNPLGMSKADFFAYGTIKRNNLSKLESIEELEDELSGGVSPEREAIILTNLMQLRLAIYNSEQVYRTKYFIVHDVDDDYKIVYTEDMTSDEIDQYIAEHSLEDNDKLLFRVDVSLNYDSGKLSGVDSKMSIGG